MSVTKTSLPVAGLNVHVFSDTSPPKSSGPVAVLFLLHGRQGSAQDSDPVAKSILSTIYTNQPAQDLLIVTFDHRNHGSRLVDPNSNEAWTGDDKHNDRHAIDMYSIQTGTAKDVSFLIDFLPSYLFPSGQRTVSQWLVAGVSLGGHSAWILLRNEPRIRIGIPIIGCADYLTLVTQRAEQSGVPTQPPYFPDSLITYIKQNDAVYSPYTARDSSNPFLGKKILTLSGAKDLLVPWVITKDFFDKLNVGEDGIKRVVVESGAGHELTPEMVKETALFIWEQVLRSP